MNESERDDVMMDATAEQIEMLRRLGADEAQLDGLTSADAEELISELQSMREDAGRLD